MKYDLSYTKNRELSWLQFNMRVLEEAEDPKNPPLERLRFLSIFCTNLDEFFMVRVGSLLDKSILTPDERDNKSGDTPKEQLDAIYKTIPDMMERRDRAYSRIMDKLAKKKVTLIPYEKLKSRDKKFIDNYYDFYLRPVLSPQIVERSHPFPHLKNKTLYAAAQLYDERNAKKALGIVEMPDEAPRLIYLTTDKKIRFVRTEDVIVHRMDPLFRRFDVTERAIIAVTRNADISVDDDDIVDNSPRYREHMEVLMKARDRLAPVRLEVEGEAKGLVKALSRKLALDKNQICISSCPAVIKWAYSVAAERADLLYPAFTPVWPQYLDRSRPMRSQIRERDVLLFYPYHSMEPFLDLLREAAGDSSVTAISITLYRVARGSAVIKHLVEAARRGKTVTVLVELRARFDEENNIGWAKVLEDEGCRIIYGQEDYKCHSKICLIKYRRGAGDAYITQVGTGNYNEKTAAQYTDFCIMSADQELGRDAESFFAHMLAGELDKSYSHLLVAPHDMKPKLIDLIEREKAKGAAGRIVIKTNAVTERDIIDKLAEASQAGVKIDLIVRGICCLIPGVPDKTANISVTSIVGRFLEHSRIYAFGTGEEREIYISSADIMTRNQQHRVEIACPVRSKELKEWFGSYLELLLLDDTHARRMIYPGDYVRKDTDKHDPVDIQHYYIDHPVELSPSSGPLTRALRSLKSFILPHAK